MIDSKRTFSLRLAERQPDPSGRRWIFVPYDQLSDRIGPLSREDPSETGILLVESRFKAARRPYHKQKLALVLANLRHFALEQAARGVAVRHVVTDGSFREALETAAREVSPDRPIRVMNPAERELRSDLAPLFASGCLEELPHEGWLTTRDQFERSQKKTPWRMDAFYRLVRRESGILMRDGKPVGGKFSFDTENRKRWPGSPPAATPPTYPMDPVKEEVGDLVAARFDGHPGTLNLDALPATATDALDTWNWARRHCLPQFGPFEDAMSSESTNLFHTRISGLMHLHRLLPSEIVREAASLEIPLASQEGFIRQVIGWREFMHHVHEATDGFCDLPAGAVECSGDRASDTAAPSFLGASNPLPPAFWGTPSGLSCLDRVVRDVWEEGYGHHITRLMILSNIATLLDVSPRELTDWFWVAYTDAYDWVVEPNVLGMGTFALGPLMTTKPYVSGAAYIDRMSDFCKRCVFDPRKNCPITSLYWAFLDRHRRQLEGNPRMSMPYRALNKRDATRRQNDRAVFRQVGRRLAHGERLEP